MHDVESRLRGIVWVIAIFFILVVSQLFYLQILKGKYYQIFSENNSIKDVSLPATRGLIFDRKGDIVVDNRPIFDLVLVPQYISNKEELISTLNNLFGYDDDWIRASFKDASNYAPYIPYVIDKDVGMNVVSVVRARKVPFEAETDYNLDGIDIQYRYVRDYTEGDIAAHLLGYVREIDQKRLVKLEEEYPGRYKQGDYIGINGVEETYDIFVRGRDGLHQKIVDALGREVNYPDIAFGLINRQAVTGGNLYLTLDLDLQKRARDLLLGKRGAVVAIEPSSGRILTMYSSPGYDLNVLTSKSRNEYWASLVNDVNKPLFNRAIRAVYPPASTYKIVTAIAALEEGVVDRDERITCHGGLRYGNRVFGCWRRGGHGSVSFITALTRSCDVYFYNMGLRLGIDRIAKYAKSFGFGKKTGFELPGEEGGLIPTAEWKLENRGEKWQKSETLSAAIGQGYDLTTPLQLALLGAEVGNGGYKVVPFIVEKVVSPDGDLLYKRTWNSTKIEGVSDETLELVKKGLVNVVEGGGGTAHRLSVLKLKIAGKTGTAQVVSKAFEDGREERRSHAWFVGYAPYDNPKIAVAAIVEHGGHGSSAAAPIVGQIIKGYLGDDKATTHISDAKNTDDL